MPYVERDEENNVIGVYARPQAGIAEEFLALDSEEWKERTLFDDLRNRCGEVSELFAEKIGVGFTFNDPTTGNPQVFESSDSGLRWLDRSALRARKSKDDTEGKTFKARAKGRVKVVMTDDELIDLASDFFDWGTLLDDEMQDRKDALYDICEGAGTVAERQILLDDYDIETGW